MSIWPFHVTLDGLRSFTADELPPRRRRRVAAHLRSCPRCQRRLRFVNRLGIALDGLEGPPPPADLLDRVIEARTRGERSILPGGAVSARARGRRTGRLLAAAGVAAAVILAVAMVVGRSPSLAAVSQASDLRVSPAQPLPEDVLDVEYRPGPNVPVGMDSLVIRVRFRRAGNEMYSVPPGQVRQAGILRRIGEGRFRGTFRLPTGVVFAAMVVETPDGRWVDDNAGRFWEVLTHAPEGYPLFESLIQRANDLMGRSWDLAYATARDAAERYPERIGSWTLREFFELAILGEAARDSAVATYGTRLATLVERAKRSESLAADEIGHIYFRAYRVAQANSRPGDSLEMAYWWDRLRSEHPRHPQVAQRVAIDLAGALWATPRVLLDSLDAQWRRLAPLRGPGRNLAIIGRQAAEHLGDRDAVALWGARALAGEPDSALRMAMALSVAPSGRQHGVDALRALLRGPANALISGRALGATFEEHAAALANVRGNVLEALGRALLALGDTGPGLDTLVLATRVRWDGRLFQDVGALLLTVGDTLGGHRLLAGVAVDPRTEPAQADAIRAAGIAAVGRATWDSLVRAAGERLRVATLARASDRAVLGETRVAHASGDTLEVFDLTGARPAVIVFWSRYCGPALAALPEIVRTGDRLRRAGTPFIFVVDEPESSDLGAFLAERGVDFPVFHDVAGRTKAAFASFGTPQYFVVDEVGRIRFDEVDAVGDLLTQVSVLRSAAP